MHHVEGNGPNDLSSTLRFQRDAIKSFLCYPVALMILKTFNLPWYLIRNGRYSCAVK